MDIKLQNTLTGEKERFSSISDGTVSMYHCGPTVYGRQHIGNLSMFVFTDVLRRTFEYFDYKVNQVINITDFGHLSGDNEGNADIGEDKMTKGLKAEGLEINMENMKVLAKKYADIFKADLEQLNIKKPSHFPFASDYIEEQKKLIEKLEEKGLAYIISDGVYFDTEKFPNYGKLGPHSVKDFAGQARISENLEKKNPKDFVLWKISEVPPMSDIGKQELGWESKWGRGFPGWHIECTAMIFALLGEQIDIHTGGIEHIGVHHNNEIAQAEAASGKSPFSRFWLHREHIRIDDTKLSKSTGNVLYLSDLKERGIHPLSYRYWLLTSRYNTPSNFTWEAVEGAQVALEKIVAEYAEKPRMTLGSGIAEGEPKVIFSFSEAIADDLNTPVAIALLQEINDKETINKMDQVLGLNIKKLAEQIREIPDEIKDLQKQRDEARKNNDYKLSDELRDKIEHAGFMVKDTGNSSLILRSLSTIAQ
ncbi:MAG TPA: cysteine--tRNA ligase [Candidatus Paceibacterota bacterium]